MVRALKSDAYWTDLIHDCSGVPEFMEFEVVMQDGTSHFRLKSWPEITENFAKRIKREYGAVERIDLWRYERGNNPPVLVDRYILVEV